MKFTRILTIGLLSSLGIAAASAADVTLNYKFVENSSLSSGNWVRIAVPETGVYEISYDKIREMGFSDPSKVGVYGHGGNQLNFNFTTSGGAKNYFDDPQQVPVLHHKDKLIFYGTGTEEINVSSTGSSPELKFTRDTRNIYSNTAYYFLSDAYPVNEIKMIDDLNRNNSNLRSSGVAYVYHENDLAQGGNATAQIFYGETFSPSNPFVLNFTRPYVKADPVYVSSTLALGKETSGTVSIDVNGNSKSTSFISLTGAMKVFEQNDNKSVLSVDANGVGTGNIKFSLSAGLANKLVAMDWVIVGYPLNLDLIAKDNNLTQQYIALPSTNDKYWKIKVPSNVTVWDITSKRNPAVLDVAEGYAYGMSNSSPSQLIVFNPDKEMKQIGQWNKIQNQNLHALQNEGIELLIFTTSDMKPYANRIAAAHEKYDGIKVAVVTPEELYNEFNYGSADPVAYRALAKMLFQNKEKPLRNLLFLGKLSSDIRNIGNNPDFSEALIAFQDNGVTDPMSHVSCVMDYYGIMTDYIPYTNNLPQAPISLGIGLLPVTIDEEGGNVASKIEEFLSREDQSNMVNETMIISCEGDYTLHDQQSAAYADLLQGIQEKEYNSLMSHYHLRLDGLEKTARKQQFKDAIERGKLYNMYFGHGIDNSIAGTYTIEELMSLENKELGFWFIAACDLCSPDLNRQGFGDAGVTKAKRGFIGTIVGTRSVMSNDNESLARTFFKNLYYDSNNQLRTSHPTIGEAFAMAKNTEHSQSSLAFLLIGDPALKLPLSMGRVELEVEGNNAHPGDVVTVKGKVLDLNSKLNSNYNGFATVKLMEPPVAIKFTIPESNGEIVSTDITDLRLATVVTEVKNGQFEVSLPIPQKAIQYMSTDGQNSSLQVYAATYDPSDKLGCSGVSFVTMAENGTERGEDAVVDNVAPVVSLSYDPLLQSIHVDATDNIALMPGIGNGKAISLTIAGKSYEAASNYSDGVSTGSYSASVSTARLPKGEYTVSAIATDLAGNKSTPAEMIFKVADAAPLTLEPEMEFAIDEMTFGIKGDMKGESCVIVISDLEGNVLATEDVTGNKVTLDLADFKPGIYKAVVRHDSAKGAVLSSNWVKFTVID